MLNEDLSIEYLIKEPQLKTSESPLLLLLHGFGSNESDLHSFANYLPENHYIVSIRAPFKLPNGGFAWYNISFDKDMNKFNDHDQAKDSINMIINFIEEVFPNKLGLDSRITPWDLTNPFKSDSSLTNPIPRSKLANPGQNTSTVMFNQFLAPVLFSLNWFMGL